MEERYFLIKGPFCFVFSSEDASSPKYAVGLQNMRAKLQNQSGHVTLETSLGDVKYEFTFANEELAKDFSGAVEKEAATAQAEVTRRRLGHAHLLQEQSSIQFAEKIAKTKECEQPDAPLTAQEVMANMPEVAF